MRLWMGLLLLSGVASAELSARPNYLELNEKIIVPKCLACHNDNYAARGVYLVTYDDVSGHAVSGNPDRSLLHEVVSNKSMPMNGVPLDSREVQYIREWISAGMPRE
jgi:hypothetical protein